MKRNLRSLYQTIQSWQTTITLLGQGTVLGRWLWSVRMQVVVQALSRFLDAGLPLLSALQILEAESQRQTVKTTLSMSVVSVHEGQPLSVAWAPMAPRLMVTLLKISEQSGNLPEMLRHWSEHLLAQQTRTKAVVKLCGYPFFVLLTNFALLLYVTQNVLPSIERLTGILNGHAVTAPMTWAMWINRIPLIFLVVGVLLSMWILVGHRLEFTMARTAPSLLIRWTPGRLLRTSYRTSHFCLVLATLTGSGVPLIDSLGVMVEGAGPKWLLREAQATRERLLGGMPPSMAFQGKWDPALATMLRWGETTGDLAGCFQDVHRTTSTWFLNRMHMVMKMAEPAILALLGGCVLATLAVVFVPMYNELSLMVSGNAK